MEWIAYAALGISAITLLLNVFSTRQKTLKERRDDTRTRIDDLEDRVAECEKRHEIRDKKDEQRVAELDSLREQNYKLYRKLNP